MPHIGLGKTIIITGANTGLGKEAARHFVRLRADKVILACRSIDKGEEAKRDIESTTQRTGVLEVWPLDLTDFASIKAFASRAEGLERLDVVVENAGVNTRKFKMVAGNEMNVAVSVQVMLMAFKGANRPRTYVLMDSGQCRGHFPSSFALDSQASQRWPQACFYSDSDYG